VEDTVDYGEVSEPPIPLPVEEVSVEVWREEH
jgi:hypothetical protein